MISLFPFSVIQLISQVPKFPSYKMLENCNHKAMREMDIEKWGGEERGGEGRPTLKLREDSFERDGDDRKDLCSSPTLFRVGREQRMNFSIMEGARIVSLAELLQLGGAFTGSSSIARFRNDLARESYTVDLASLAFRAFNFPVILVGTWILASSYLRRSWLLLLRPCGERFAARFWRWKCPRLREKSAFWRGISFLSLRIARFWRSSDGESTIASSFPPRLLNFPRMEHSKSVRSRACGVLIAVRPRVFGSLERNSRKWWRIFWGILRWTPRLREIQLRKRSKALLVRETRIQLFVKRQAWHCESVKLPFSLRV